MGTIAQNGESAIPARHSGCLEVLCEYTAPKVRYGNQQMGCTKIACPDGTVVTWNSAFGFYGNIECPTALCQDVPCFNSCYARGVCS